MIFFRFLVYVDTFLLTKPWKLFDKIYIHYNHVDDFLQRGLFRFVELNVSFWITKIWLSYGKCQKCFDFIVISSTYTLSYISSNVFTCILKRWFVLVLYWVYWVCWPSELRCSPLAIGISISMFQVQLHGALPCYVNSGTFVARCRLTRSRRWRLVVSVVLTHLNFGNSVLAGLPVHLVRRLQSVLNVAARLMPNTHRRRDETVLSRRRRRCEHNSQLAHDDCRRIQSTVWKLTKQTP